MCGSVGGSENGNHNARDISWYAAHDRATRHGLDKFGYPTALFSALLRAQNSEGDKGKLGMEKKKRMP